MDQLDDATIARFLAGEIDGEELARIDRILDESPSCRERLANAARANESMLLASHAGPTGPAKPGARTALPLEPARDPFLGRVIGGRYRVLRKIGGGGMGAVYEAEHALIGRHVALKVLHPQWASNQEVVRRFQNEARAAGTLGHPGILQALDMGRTEDGMPFLVLELLEGHDLDAELSRRGALPIGRAVKMAMEIADALAAAHAAGIVHRDLKPENVFLLKDGSLKVLDFGISKIASSIATGPATAPGALMGTPMYMAPEQFEDAGSATPRSDVYALGVILYRALTGRLPHQRDSLQALLLAIVSSEPTPIAELRSDVPEELAMAVAKAMCPKAEDRFASMEALATVIAPYQKHGARISSFPEAMTELRVATVLVALGVSNFDEAARLVADAGGRPTKSDERGAFVAVFGERTWQGDEGVRAVTAGLALRQVATATAVASGHIQRDGDTVSGDAVERALEACHAKLSGVAVVQPSSRVEASFVLRRVTDELGEATGEAATGWSILPAGTESQPLLGREGELAQLRSAFSRMLEEQRPATVWITGGPGLGKTRLVAEVLRLADEQPQKPAVLIGRGRSQGAEQRGMIVQAISARARWATVERGWPRLSAEVSVDERRRAVAMLAAEAVDAEHAPDLAEFLGELLGVAMPATSALGAARANARLMSDRLDLAVRAYFDGLTEHMPVVLLLEDLQWSDPQSLTLVEQLIADVAWDRPLLVIGTARPEGLDETPAPFDGPETIELKLRGMGLADVHTLATWITGQELEPELARVLLDRTGGNPLFLEQTLAALRDEGRDLAGLDPSALPLPPDVEAAVQARLDALEEDGRDVLRAAAMLAGAFTLDDLGRVLDIAPKRELMMLLERAGLLRRRPGRERGVSWDFRTSLVAEVVYRMMTAELRRALHLKVAAALGLRNEDDPERIAVHLDRAGASVDAARYYHNAAMNGARHQDTPKVLRCAARALSLGAADDARFSLHMAVADAFEVEGRLEEQARALEEASRMATTGEERARVAMTRGVRTLRTQSAAESLPLFEAAVEEAREAGDAELLARALGRLATALVYSGELDRAAGTLGEAERLVMTRAPTLGAEVATWRAQLAAAQGDLGARRNAYMAAVELYDELGDARNLAGASINLADVLNRFGAYEDAERALGEAREAARRLGIRLFEGYALANRGYARAMAGRMEEARTDLSKGLAIAEKTGDGRLAVFARLYRSRLEWSRGDATAAVAEATAVVEAAAPLELHSAVVLARIVIANAKLASGDVKGALAETDAAMSLRRELGGLEEDEAELFTTHARALEAAGRGEDAHAIRKEGAGVLQATAARIMDPALRDRYLQGIEAHRALLD